MDIPMNGLTHVDVEQQTFHASFRGYAEDEVDQFLDDVVASLRTLHQMVADRDQRIVSLAKGDGGDPDHAVSGALIEAQRTADRIVAEARAEAESVSAGKTVSAVDEAQYQADLERHTRLKAELGALQTSFNSIVAAATAAADALGQEAVAAEPTVPAAAAVTEAPVFEVPPVHTVPEIGLVGFVDPVSLVDETEETTLHEIPAAVEQAEDRFAGTRLSDVMRSIEEPPPPVDEVPLAADDGDADELREPSRRPWERG